MASYLNVSNVKVSVKVVANYQSLYKLRSKLSVKKENTSFYVFRKNRIVFCIYYKGHVNITGLRTSNEINNCILFLQAIPGVKKIESVKIDNITCSGCLHNSVYKWNQSFSVYLQKLSKTRTFNKIQYCPQTFPGAFLKTFKGGTIVFFATGKFNVVGCKSYKDINILIQKFICALKQLK